MEENHAVHYMLEFADGFDMRTSLELHHFMQLHIMRVQSMWICFVDEFKHAAHYANELEFNLQRVSITEDFSLQLDNINFRNLLNRKTTNVLQTES